MLAEMLLLANTAMTNKEQVQYEGLRLLLDRLNSISDVATKEFESQISEIDQKADNFPNHLTKLGMNGSQHQNSFQKTPH